MSLWTTRVTPVRHERWTAVARRRTVAGTTGDPAIRARWRIAARGRIGRAVPLGSFYTVLHLHLHEQYLRAGQGQAVVCLVRDAGHAISAATVERIFSYLQPDRPTHRNPRRRVPRNISWTCSRLPSSRYGWGSQKNAMKQLVSKV